MAEQPPWNHPFQYNPGGSFGFDMQGLGPLAAQLSAQYLQQYAGPTNFLPHQMPGQNVADQMVMQQYFRSTQHNTFGTNRMGTGAMANTILGGMAAFTNKPMTDLNRQQAHTAAGIINHPYLKPMIAAAVGPENLEALMFGPKGDPAAIAGAANRIGYYRQDPATGAQRMSGESLETFSKSLYANLYEPAGNISDMVSKARKGDTAALRSAARADNEKIVTDTELTQRIADRGAEEVGKIYKKFQPGGKAATVQEQAQELVKFDRAVKQAGVLGTNETSIAGLQRRAENAAVESMHGFMAGQTGQVAEHLFQRGMLPQSIGALSAADRVKVLSKENLDKETLGRLAKEFGHRDLMDKNKDYAAAFNSGNVAEQERIMGEKLPSYESRINTSMKKIKARQAAGGPIGAEEAQKLLSLDGMDSVAGNIDAKRSSGVIKKHTEALAAIREIFGDNGNTNAPVPALLAALDHLSQGSSHRMSSNKVASTLREMRGTAKELGMGIGQLGALSASVEAYGTQLGLAGETRMGAVADTLSTLKAMDRGGAFANAKFGSLSKEEAQQKVGMLATRSEASTVSKGAAAIMRAYTENKANFTDAAGKANTELGVIAEKMKDPNWDGNYTFGGQNRNFYNNASVKGTQEFARIAQASNMTPTQMRILMNDKMTQEYQQSGAGLKAARADAVNVISNMTMLGAVGRGASGVKGVGDVGVAGGNTRKAVADQITGMVIDSADMDGKDQLEHLEKQMPAELAKTVAKQNGRDTPNADDKKQAQQLFENMFGKDEATRRTNIQTAVSRISQATGEITTAPNTRALKQILTGTASLGKEQAARTAAAEQAFASGFGMEGTPLSRAGQYLSEIGVSGEGFNFDEFLKSTFGIKAASEMRDKMAPELKAAFAKAEGQISDATVNKKYLNELEEGKATDHRGRKLNGEAEMRRLAARDLKGEELEKFNNRFKTKIGDEEIAKRRTAKFNEIAADEGKLKALYKNAVPGGTAATAEEMKKELVELNLVGAGTSVAGLRDVDLVSEEKGEYTRGQMRAAAEQAALGKEKDEGRRAEYAKERAAGIAQYTGLFGRSEAEVRRGLRDALTTGAKKGGYELKDDGKSTKMTGLLDKAMDLNVSDDDLKKYVATNYAGLNEKQRTELLTNVSDFRAAKRANLADKIDPNAAMSQETPTTSPSAQQAPAPGAPTEPGKSAEPGAGSSGERGVAAGVEKGVEKLVAVITQLEEPFNKLIAALEQSGGRGKEAPTQANQAQNTAVQTATSPSRAAVIAQRTSGGGGGGETTIKGTLQLVGLQSAVLAAKGSPVFTPTGDGPAIVPGSPAPGAYLGSSAVNPGQV